MKARVKNEEGHLCLQGSMMIESRRKRVPEVRDSSRRGNHGCVEIRNINNVREKSVLFV